VGGRQQGPGRLGVVVDQEVVHLVGAEVHGCFMPWKAWDILLGRSERELPPEEFAWISQYRDRTVLFGNAVRILSLAQKAGATQIAIAAEHGAN